MRYAILFLILVSCIAQVHASEITCTYAALIAELDRLEACGVDYSTATCQPANEHCASSNTLDGGETATCCSGENAGTCDAGRKITFNCSSTTIYWPSFPTKETFCSNGTDLQTSCDVDGDCGSGTCESVAAWCPAEGPYAVDETLCTAANTPYQCCTGNGTGTCCEYSGDTEYYEDHGTYGAHRRLIPYLIIDGETNNVTMEMDPPWWHSCPTYTACDGYFGEIPRTAFILAGDYSIIRDLTFNNFYTGLQMSGENQLVHGVTIDSTAEDGLLIGRDNQNWFSGNATTQVQGVLIEDSTVIRASEKAIQTLDQSDGFSYPTMRATFDNVTISDAKWCWQLSNGRWKITNSTCEAGDDSSTHWARNEGLSVRHSGGSAAVAYVSDTTIEGSGTYDDIRACVHVSDDGTLVSEGGNTFENCATVGVIVREQSKALLEGDIIQNNGGFGTWYSCDGGVCADDSATTDLGGGSTSIDGRGNLSSAGGNSLIDNLDSDDAALDVWNQTTNTIKAEGNWWGADENPDTTGGKITGTVDVIPWLDAAPGGVGVCGDNTKDAGELCDGTDLDSNNCTTIGESWTGGTLACDAGCNAWDTTACEVLECGDDQVDSPEVCDGAVLPENCADNGFAGGTIACAADCLSFDTSGCSNVGGGTGVTGVGATGMGLK